MGIPRDVQMNTSAAPAPPSDSTAPLSGGVPANWSWVPIRSLGPRHRERITSHLLALDVGDRYLRFGYPANDAQMSKYVDMLDFEHDEVFGIFNRRLELIAMAHLAHPTVLPAAGSAAMSEFGVSVVPPAAGSTVGCARCAIAISSSLRLKMPKTSSCSKSSMSTYLDSCASFAG